VKSLQDISLLMSTTFNKKAIIKTNKTYLSSKVNSTLLVKITWLFWTARSGVIGLALLEFLTGPAQDNFLRLDSTSFL